MHFPQLQKQRGDPKHEVVEEQFADETPPSVLTDAEGDTRAKDTKCEKVIIGSQPKRNHNMFTHFPNDPNCEVCKKTKKHEPGVE